MLHANRNLLDLTGYRLDEIQGRHHRLFCEPDDTLSSTYAAFWDHLSSSQVHDDEFKRLGKNGREVCIRASYNPVFDPKGHPVKVVKFATDITEARRRMDDNAYLHRTFEQAQAGIRP